MTSCSFLGSSSNSKKKRGSLADAMEKAGDEYKGERTVEQNENNSNKNDDDEKTKKEKNKSAVNKAASPNKYKLDNDSIKNAESLDKYNSGIALSFQRTLAQDNDFQDANELRLSVYLQDTNTNRIMGGYAFTLAFKDTKSGTKTASSIKQSVTDISAQIFLVSAIKSLQLEFSGGAGYMFWTFKNTIISGSDRINSDNLVFYNLGMDLTQLIRLKQKHYIAPSLGFKFQFYDSETGEGFNNDYFSAFLQFHIRVSYLFF
jgi:hypothetical protein